MKVTKLEEVDSIQCKSEKPSEIALKNEHNYLVAERLTKMLFDKGLITQAEYIKIMEKNRITFSPFLAEIMSYDVLKT